MEELIEKYTDRINNAISKAEAGKTKLTNQQLMLEGMSADKNRIFLNEMVHSDTRYLEIGAWKASTFVAAMYENQPEFSMAIDDFSQFGGNIDHFNSVCNSNLNYNFNVINQDCFNILDSEKDKIKDINLYFYDGGHSTEDQRKALTMFVDKMSKIFIYVVDDWNYFEVPIGTRRGIQECSLKVHKEWQLNAKYNGDRENWWNGFYVAIIEKV